MSYYIFICKIGSKYHPASRFHINGSSTLKIQTFLLDTVHLHAFPQRSSAVMHIVKHSFSSLTSQRQFVHNLDDEVNILSRIFIIGNHLSFRLKSTTREISLVNSYIHGARSFKWEIPRSYFKNNCWKSSSSVLNVVKRQFVSYLLLLPSLSAYLPDSWSCHYTKSGVG